MVMMHVRTVLQELKYLPETCETFHYGFPNHVKLPHVLSPDTSLTEASQLMQQYGYEGYPVVDEGKVIGLITRKVVDKALGHQLNISVRNLMDANEVWVYPDDSIQQLQSQMTDTGWGQIPVVDPESGEMIGIVTRTDL